MRQRRKLPTFYTVQEIARCLYVHPQSVRRAIRQGRLGAYRFGDKGSALRVPAEALARFLRSTALGVEWNAGAMAARHPVMSRRMNELREGLGGGRAGVSGSR